jgi:hypothetical protein
VEEGCDVAWGRKSCVSGGLSGNETTEVRKRKSEEMKVKAKGEGEKLLNKRWFKSLNLNQKPRRSPIHGKKVPL